MSQTHYIGIDLGTSNCAAAKWSEDKPETIDLQQEVDHDQVSGRPTLPSVLFIPPGGKPVVTGSYSKELAKDQSRRGVTSAKSWLCHDGINPHDKILPWNLYKHKRNCY